MGKAFLFDNEMTRVRKQIEAAEVVVRFKELTDQGQDPWLWPEYDKATGDFEAADESSHFILERRVGQ